MFIKIAFKSILKRFNFSITRIEKNINSEWFIFDKSCQIPNLSFIYQYIFGKDYRGKLIEVGAFDGVSFSNSMGLLDRGWHGILVEPVPTFAAKCEARYLNNPNIRVIRKAISNKSGSQKLNLAGPLSTLSAENVIEYKTLDWSRSSVSDISIEVQTLTLDELLNAELMDSDFDLLIVDVEGFEQEVFEGFDLKRWNPKMLVIELSDFHPTLKSNRQDHSNLSDSLTDFGYSIIYKDAINTIFLRTDFKKQLFKFTD